VLDHPSRIGERSEQLTGDPQRRFLPTTPDDFASHRLLEPGQPEPASPVQVTTVALADNAHRGRPSLRPERVARGVQRRRPDTLEQRTDLLDLADRGFDQLLPAAAQMPQPSPGFIHRFGQVAA
jgi:hypothetical protein